MPRKKRDRIASRKEVRGGFPGGKPHQRNAANARERARMRVLSRAFCRLKTTLPWVPADTKLSKLDTLRLASSYIAHLKRELDGGGSDPSVPIPTSGVNMTWPFGLSRSLGGGSGSGRCRGGGEAFEEGAVGGDSGESWGEEYISLDYMEGEELYGHNQGVMEEVGHGSNVMSIG